MRIAYVTDSWYPNVNGVITSMEAFKREHERQGHEVFIFCPRYFGKDEMGPTVYRFPSIPYPFKMMREQRIVFPVMRVLRKIRELSIDIIHTQSPAFAAVGAILASRLWRIPHVHSFHTHFMSYMHYAPIPKPIARPGIIWIARHLTGKAQTVITPGEGMREILQSYGVDSPLVVLPTGAPVDRGVGSMSWGKLFSKYELGGAEQLEGRNVLVFVGRLGPEKNIEFLIRSLSQLRKSRSDFHFLLVGDGPYRADIEKAVDAHGLSDQTTLTGYISHEDVLEAVRLSRLFICASLTETQGLVVLESMMVGTPVVAVRAMGVEDMIDHDIGGFMTPNDETLFARKIGAILDDSDLHRTKSREALERAQEFSMENQALRMEAIYRDAIDDFARHGVPRYGRHHRF